MHIPMACNKCGRKFKVPESAAGRKAKCPDPKCGAIVLVPASSSAQAEKPGENTPFVDAESPDEELPPAPRPIRARSRRAEPPPLPPLESAVQPTQQRRLRRKRWITGSIIAVPVLLAGAAFLIIFGPLWFKRSEIDQARADLARFVDTQQKIAKKLDSANDATSFASAIDALTDSVNQFKTIFAKYEVLKKEGAEPAGSDLRGLATNAGKAMGINCAAARNSALKFNTSPTVITAFEKLQAAIASAASPDTDGSTEQAGANEATPLVELLEQLPNEKRPSGSDDTLKLAQASNWCQKELVGRRASWNVPSPYIHWYPDGSGKNNALLDGFVPPIALWGRDSFLRFTTRHSFGPEDERMPTSNVEAKGTYYRFEMIRLDDRRAATLDDSVKAGGVEISFRINAVELRRGIVQIEVNAVEFVGPRSGAKNSGSDKNPGQEARPTQARYSGGTTPLLELLEQLPKDRRPADYGDTLKLAQANDWFMKNLAGKWASWNAPSPVLKFAADGKGTYNAMLSGSIPISNLFAGDGESDVYYLLYVEKKRTFEGEQPEEAKPKAGRGRYRFDVTDLSDKAAQRLRESGSGGAPAVTFKVVSVTINETGMQYPLGKTLKPRTGSPWFLLLRVMVDDVKTGD